MEPKSWPCHCPHDQLFWMVYTGGGIPCLVHRVDVTSHGSNDDRTSHKRPDHLGPLSPWRQRTPAPSLREAVDINMAKLLAFVSAWTKLDTPLKQTTDRIGLVARSQIIGLIVEL